MLFFTFTTTPRLFSISGVLRVCSLLYLIIKTFYPFGVRRVHYLKTFYVLFCSSFCVSWRTEEGLNYSRGTEMRRSFPPRLIPLFLMKDDI